MCLWWIVNRIVIVYEFNIVGVEMFFIFFIICIVLVNLLFILKVSVFDV